MKKIKKKSLFPAFTSRRDFIKRSERVSRVGGKDDRQREITNEKVVNEKVTDVGNENKEVNKTEIRPANRKTEFQGLKFDKEIPVEETRFFTIDSYENGYYVININRNRFSQRILVVPEGKEVPEGAGEDLVVIKQPVTTSRIDSQSLMDLLEKIQPELLDNITLTAYPKEKMKIERVAKNMESGKAENSGSVKEINVELVKSKNPGAYLALSSLPGQESYEKLKQAGIDPVITFYHQETDPFGRLEWIKLLGAVYGNMEEAESFYRRQKAVLETVDASKADGKSFIMFCLNKKKDIAYVKRSGDVIAKMGCMAGGKNALSDPEKGGWEEMSIAEFSDKYKDTDYLIYMTDYGNKAGSVKDLTDISAGISDFKAVKENNVWRTSKDYALMNDCGDMIRDLNMIFSGDSNVGGSGRFVNITG